MKRALVVTTISAPNRILQELALGAQEHQIQFFVVGDTKSPRDFTLPGADYYDIVRQEASFPHFCSLLPTRHYSRKNVGYLLAMRDGVETIQETDDDNSPNIGFWSSSKSLMEVDKLQSADTWVNVYALFTEERIWPRGFPLDQVTKESTFGKPELAISRALITQGMADDNPDVDAIYRLLYPLPIRFRERKPVLLGAGSWCPFNSQNTIFKREAYPLMYLPSFCSFRMTDIWRSFVAQRCLWEMGEGVVFTSATVSQERNEHSLMKDFEDEVPGYLRNDELRKTLETCELSPTDVLGNLIKCYEALCNKNFIGEKELPLLRAWAHELERF